MYRVRLVPLKERVFGNVRRPCFFFCLALWGWFLLIGWP